MSGLLWCAIGLFLLSALHGLLCQGWRLAIQRAVERSGPESPGPMVMITTIIPARNAGNTIAALLQDVNAQRYPKELTEVLVVDDGSEDATARTVQGMMRTWPQLRLIALSGAQGKKAAIAKGVEQARGELILLTDADARLDRDRLPALMRLWANTRADLILMPVHTQGEGVLGGLQEDEQAALTGAAAGSGLTGTPILANGANMAFTRSAFAAVGGYDGDRFASGDDMFLLRRMRRAGKNVGYLMDRDVLVTVEAERTWKAFFSQRLRWAGKMRGVGGIGLWSGLFTVLLPWSLAVLTVHALDEVSLVRGWRLATLIICAWLMWVVPVIRLASEVKRSWGVPRRPFRLLFSLVVFPIYAPLVAMLSLFVRPEWRGRRI